MATIQKSEDLICWQKAREYCKIIYKLTEKACYNTDYRFKSQFNSSAGSIMDNIAEGFARDGNKEFIQFLSIAKASLAENKSQTYRSLDRNFIDKEEFENTSKLANELKLILEGFMNYLRNCDIKGIKFKKM
jgi:four helix bundle protein